MTVYIHILIKVLIGVLSKEPFLDPYWSLIKGHGAAVANTPQITRVSQ